MQRLRRFPLLATAIPHHTFRKLLCAFRIPHFRKLPILVTHQGKEKVGKREGREGKAGKKGEEKEKGKERGKKRGEKGTGRGLGPALVAPQA